MATQPPPPEDPAGRPTTTEPEATSPPVTAPAPPPERAEREEVERRSAPAVAPMAALGGWLCAWGAAVLAIFSLREADVSIGMGLGLLDGAGATGFWAGLWLLVVQVGAFVLGGYVAARMAPALGLLHALGAWVLAMLATGADAIVAQLRDAGPGVLAELRMPFWADTGLGPAWKLGLVLAILAGGALVGALIGWALAAAVGRRRRPAAAAAT